MVLLTFLVAAVVVVGVIAVAWVVLFSGIRDQVVSPWAILRLARHLRLPRGRTELAAGNFTWGGPELSLVVSRWGVPQEGGGSWPAAVRVPGLPKVSWQLGNEPAELQLVPGLLAEGDPEACGPLLHPDVQDLLRGFPGRVRGHEGQLLVELRGADVDAQVDRALRLGRALHAPQDRVGPLRALVESKRDPVLRACAAILLARRHPGVVANLVLRPAAPDPEPVVRAVVDWLGGRATPHPAPLDALPAWAWRLLVLELPAGQSAAALRPLLDQARQHPDPEVSRAAWYRAVTGDPEHHAVLGAELAFVDEALATEVLGSPAGGAQWLRVGALGHRSARLRAEAVRALTVHGDARALDALERLRRRAEGRERAEVERAIAAIQARI